MSETFRKNIHVALIVLLCALGFWAKIFGPQITRSLFDQNQFSILNRIAQSPSNQDIIFYEGRVHEILWGPIEMTAFGIAFLIFALKVAQNWRMSWFVLSILGYFLLTRFEVLFFPPYGDTASGPFMEAIWLAQNKMNLIGLAHQPLFDEGGPKTYLFSIYPSYLAILMKLIPNVKAFLVVNHLLSFIFTAIVIGFFRKIALKLFDPKVSMLLSVLLLSLPLIQSQAEAINMEMPLTLFGVLSVYYLIEKRIALASVMAMLCALTKICGIILCAVVCVVGLFLFLFDSKRRFKWSHVFWGVVSMIVGVALLYFSYVEFNRKGDITMVGFLQGWFENKKLPVTWLSLISFFVFIGAFIKDLKQKRVSNLIDFIHKNYLMSVIFVTVICWFGFFLQSWGAQYRYRLLLAPFSLLCIFYAYDLLVKSKLIIRVTLIASIIFSFICSYGLIFPHTDISEHSALERTLEYRNDLIVHQKLVKEIEERFSQMTIVAPFTIAHILAFPELGFADKRLDVMIYGFSSKYPNIRNFTGLAELDLRNTMWVGFKMNLPSAFVSLLKYYPYGPGDIIVDEVTYGDRKATLFMGGQYIEKQRLLLMAILKKRMESQK